MWIRMISTAAGPRLPHARALCAQPIGIPETDPRWDGHDPDCGGCELCEDEVPIILFRGEGREMLQAAFHQRCFERLLEPQ